MKPALLVTFLASVGIMGTASAAWQRLPSAEALPVNLSNKIVLGTTVTASPGVENAEAVISGDPNAGAILPVGKSELVLSLSEQSLIDSVSFVNDGSSGKVVIACSVDQKDWISLAQAVFEDTDRHVPVKFAGAQAKHVRVSFEVAKSSAIRSFHLGGLNKLSDYKAYAVQEGSKKAVEVDATTLARSNRPIYMFPTPTNVGEADGSRTTFKFPKTKERFRTVVYDLGSVRTIKKFSAAYSRIPTRLQVFAYEQLPEKQDWRGKMTLDPAVFDEGKPVASGEDARGEGHIQVNPEQPVQAQYVALRFEPNYHKRAVAGLDPDWNAMAMAAMVPFGSLLLEFGSEEFEIGSFIQQSQGQTDIGGETFEMYDVGVGGSVQMVLISRAAIASVMSQLGPNATEAQAVGSILQAAGLTASTTGGGATGSGGEQADAAQALNNAGLSALGLAGYTSGASSGIGGGGANPPVPPGGTGAPVAPPPIIITTLPPTTN